MRASECLVDIAGDCAGLVELEAAVHQHRHALEGMKRQIAFGHICSERIYLDPAIIHGLLFKRETGNPAVDAVSVAVQLNRHGASRCELRLPDSPAFMPLKIPNCSTVSLSGGQWLKSNSTSGRPRRMAPRIRTHTVFAARPVSV